MEYDADKPDVRTKLSEGFTGQRQSSWKRGDPDQALSTALVVIDETYSTPVETHNPMEMHGTVAVWDGDNLTLYESSQGVVNHRTVMSKAGGSNRKCARDLALHRFRLRRQALPVAAINDGCGRCSPAEASGKT